VSVQNSALSLDCEIRMKISVSLPMPKSVKTDNGVKHELEPSASNAEHAWYNGANISPNHAEFDDNRGRQLPRRGLGLTRIQVFLAQTGMTQEEFGRITKTGRGSKDAKRLRS